MAQADIVRRESLAELRKLGAWFRSRHGLTIVLLGGWAVYSYNPYVGSFDIDCLGPDDPFTRYLNIYMRQNGYVLEPESPFGAASECWRKPILVEKTEIGSIYIDACDFEFRNFFKEDPTKEIPYNLCTKKEHLRLRPISGEYFYVPLILSATESREIHASTMILFAWVGIPLLRFHPHPSHRRSIGQTIGLTACSPQRAAIFKTPTASLCASKPQSRQRNPRRTRSECREWHRGQV